MEMKMNDNSTVCYQIFVLIFQSYIEEGKSHDVNGQSALLWMPGTFESFWDSVFTSIKVACNNVEKRKLKSYVLIEESIRN